MWEDVVCRKEEKEKENEQVGTQRINKPSEKIKIVKAMSRISFQKEGSSLQEFSVLTHICISDIAASQRWRWSPHAHVSPSLPVPVPVNDLVPLSPEETAESISHPILYYPCRWISNAKTLLSLTEGLPPAWRSTALLAPLCGCHHSQLFWCSLPMHTDQVELSVCEQCNVYKVKTTVIEG